MSESASLVEVVSITAVESVPLDGPVIEGGVLDPGPVQATEPARRRATGNDLNIPPILAEFLATFELLSAHERAQVAKTKRGFTSPYPQ
jgi:hypothetical protein